MHNATKCSSDLTAKQYYFITVVQSALAVLVDHSLLDGSPRSLLASLCALVVVFPIVLESQVLYGTRRLGPQPAVESQETDNKRSLPKEEHHLFPTAKYLVWHLAEA